MSATTTVEAQALEALRGAVELCRCKGSGHYKRACTMCHDSTWGHECDDDDRAPCVNERCVKARAVLARAEKRDRATPACDGAVCSNCGLLRFASVEAPAVVGPCPRCSDRGLELVGGAV